MNVNDKLDAFETGEWLDAWHVAEQLCGSQRSDHRFRQIRGSFGPRLDSH